MDLLDSSCKSSRPAVKDSLLQSVELQGVDRHKGRLLLKLNKDCQYQCFTLTNPHRLVIDLFKIVKKDISRELEYGVDYRFLQDELNGRPYQSHIITVKPASVYELRPFSAAGNYTGRASLAKMAQNLGLPVAVNASYFDTDGWVVGVTKSKGRLLSVEESPHSAYILTHKQPGIIKDVAYSGYLELKDGGRLPIKGMNRMRIADDCVIYNEAFATHTHTNRWGREIRIRNGRVEAVSTLGNMPIEPGTMVVSGHGSSAAALKEFSIGDPAKLVESLGNTAAEEAEVVVGAGPLLIEQGKINVRTREESIAQDIAVGRAPRTALGITADGSLLLVVVDGRSSSSQGMSLQELAEFMLQLGAKDALNLDGGGSSEMVLKGRIVNHPSDGRERPVSIGLGLFRK